MKKLIIAEKPNLAMKIVAGIGNMNKHDGYFENDNFLVTFAFGHLFVLKSVDDYFNRGKTPWSLDELPFVPNEFEYKLQDDSGVKKQYGIIKSLYIRNDISGVINAGDPDREGSVIILNILSQLQKETNRKYDVERIWLKATHPEYIRQALSDLHPEEYYGNLYEEGLARTYTDWLYGINFTRYVSLKCSTFLPVGRVLIPIVKFIYDRDMQIQKFITSTYFEIEANILKDGEIIRCKFNDCKYDNIDEGEKVLSFIRNGKGFVSNIDIKPVVKHSPKLFSLDTLQNKLSQENKFSSAKTLDIVQSLYEKGFVTYPRTNTEYLSESEKGLVQNIIDHLDNKKDFVLRGDDKAIFDNSKIEGHSALIITIKRPDLTQLSDDEKLVYTTIYNRFLSNFLAAKTVLEETVVTISVADQKIVLKGTVIKEKGFYQYEKSPNECFLPCFRLNEELNIKDIELVKKKTKAPSRVTEAELNTFLKNPFKDKEISECDDEEYKSILSGCEIGTVATRASIIQNALRYEYIKREKSHLTITDKGSFLISSLEKLHIDLSKNSTVEFNIFLKKIYFQKESIKELVNQTSNLLSDVISNGADVEVNKMEPSGICKCPKCKSGNILLSKNNLNYYCSNYKNNCDFKLWINIADKKLTESQIKILIEKGKTGLIKGFKSSKNNKIFDARLKLTNDFKVEFVFK